jgi:hypothetical protein
MPVPSGCSFSVVENIQTLVEKVTPVLMQINPHDGCLYFSNESDKSVKRVTLQGEVSTFIGANNGMGYPSGLAINYKENIYYVSDYCKHLIYKVTSTGTLSVFAGSAWQPKWNWSKREIQ